MKHLFKILTLASLMAMYSCNETRREQEQDSNEVAEEANEEKFEDSNVKKDADFVAEVVASNYGEIKMAQLASQRATDPEVKEIAKMLEMEHTKTLNEIKALAQTKAITVPVEEEEDAKEQAKKLSEEKAADFDKTWIKQMADHHEKEINKFEGKLDKTEDAELKGFVNKTLPHLKMHLDKIKACENKLENKKDTNS